MQMVYPVPNTQKDAGQCCQPYGRTTMIWGPGKSFPVTGEDFSYQIFRKGTAVPARIDRDRPAGPACWPASRPALPGTGAAMADTSGHRPRTQGESVSGAGSDRLTDSKTTAGRCTAGGIDIEALAGVRSSFQLSNAAPHRRSRYASSSLSTCRAPAKAAVHRPSGAIGRRAGAARLKSQSMRETVSAVGELIGERKVTWVIDPEAFTRHAVRQAPTFVSRIERCPGRTAHLRRGCVTPAGFTKRRRRRGASTTRWKPSCAANRKPRRVPGRFLER